MKIEGFKFIDEEISKEIKKSKDVKDYLLLEIVHHLKRVADNTRR